VLIGVTTVLLMLFLAPAVDRTKQRSATIVCISNLKEIGTAYRVWANDHGDLFGDDVFISQRAWSAVFSRFYTSSSFWMNYAALGDKAGKSASFLICPADERMPATNFASVANTNISYFTCGDATDTYPQAILGGDRNLGPGTTPATDYGFSPPDGKGYDVMIRGPVCWTLKMHSRGKIPTCGNILLGDGSAQQTTSANLYNNWVRSSLAATATNTAANPPSLRLLFP
jgi:hypothetical protein